MKRFQFRLARVQRVRATQEDLARAQVRLARLRVIAATDDLQGRVGRLAMMPGPAPRAATGDFLARRASLGAAAASLLAARADVAAASAMAAERVQEWHVSRSRVRALDRLEGRRRAEHMIEDGRAQTRETDDLVLTHRLREVQS